MAPTVRVETETAVNPVYEAFRDGHERRHLVATTGLGTFSTKNQPARLSRNSRTGDSIAIATPNTPSFRSGKTYREPVGQRLATRFGIPTITIECRKQFVRGV